MHTLAYNLMERLIKRAIKKGELEKKRAEYLNKLDAYLAADRMTSAEYAELVAMMGGVNND